MILFIASIVNLWIWKISYSNILIGILTILATLFVIHIYKSKKVTIGLVIVIILLMLVQAITTDRKRLVELTTNERISQISRIKQYPPTYINVFGKLFWIPAANWLELRNETLILYKSIENFSEVVDVNLYFFASHPRETDNIESFEKFPYISIPFFAIGVFNLLNRKNFKLLVLILFLPVTLSSVIGSRNPIGPFSLFPFFVLCIYLGMGYVYQKYVMGKKGFSYVFIGVYSLIFIQTIIYAIN